jgi:hypothetical protein
MRKWGHIIFFVVFVVMLVLAEGFGSLLAGAFLGIIVWLLLLFSRYRGYVPNRKELLVLMECSGIFLMILINLGIRFVYGYEMSIMDHAFLSLYFLIGYYLTLASGLRTAAILRGRYLRRRVGYGH